MEEKVEQLVQMVKETGAHQYTPTIYPPTPQPLATFVHFNRDIA